MTPTTRAAWIALWIVAIGLGAVWLEVENVRAGVRLRDLMIEREVRVERFRRLELRFNRMASPDLLQKELPPDFRAVETGAEARSEQMPGA